MNQVSQPLNLNLQKVDNYLSSTNDADLDTLPLGFDQTSDDQLHNPQEEDIQSRGPVQGQEYEMMDSSILENDFDQQIEDGYVQDEPTEPEATESVENRQGSALGDEPAYADDS